MRFQQHFSSPQVVTGVSMSEQWYVDDVRPPLDSLNVGSLNVGAKLRVYTAVHPRAITRRLERQPAVKSGADAHVRAQPGGQRRGEPDRFP